jgi:EAL domain-containing protein (putative c-di-GMP-specific phosphodiesterase class I)
MRSFSEVARHVVGAEDGGRVQWNDLSLGTFFQSIHAVERGEAVGSEALVRIIDAAGRPLPARPHFEALDPAERIRFDWTARALHLRNYAVVDPGDRKLFLNVHPVALVGDPDGGRSFAELVRFYGLSPSRVVLEVLEGDSGDEEKLGDAVASHRDHGFGVAMDRFGEGRSNFDRIAVLRPNIVKMECSMLRNALGVARGRRMLPSLVQMLEDAGARVAVKRIDNALDALAAIEAGAAYLQGHHLGAPTRNAREDNLAPDLIQAARRLAFA